MVSVHPAVRETPRFPCPIQVMWLDRLWTLNSYSASQTMPPVAGQHFHSSLLALLTVSCIPTAKPLIDRQLVALPCPAQELLILSLLGAIKDSVSTSMTTSCRSFGCSETAIEKGKEIPETRLGEARPRYHGGRVRYRRLPDCGTG